MKLTHEMKEKLKPVFLKQLPEYIAQHLGGDGFCLSYSWLVAHVMDFLAIRSVTKCVRGLLINPMGQQIVYQFGFNRLIQMVALERSARTRNIWTISIGLFQGTFHAVVIFKDDQSILDGTISPMSRPTMNLHVANYWELRETLPSCLFRKEMYPFHDDYASFYDFQFTDQEIYAGFLATLPMYPTIIETTCQMIEHALGLEIYNKDSKIANLLKSAKQSNAGITFDEVGARKQVDQINKYLG